MMNVLFTDFHAYPNLKAALGLTENHAGEFHSLRVCDIAKPPAAKDGFHEIGRMQSNPNLLLVLLPQCNRVMSSSMVVDDTEVIIIHPTLMKMINADQNEYVFTLEENQTGTVLGWSFYGERCTEFLFGERAIKPFRFVWVAVVVIGSVAGDRGVVWGVADTLNGLMALPNLVSLLLLSPVIFKLTGDYNFNRSQEEG